MNFNMENICPKCHINPKAHSFKILKPDDQENLSNTTIFIHVPLMQKNIMILLEYLHIMKIC